MSDQPVDVEVDVITPKEARELVGLAVDEPDVPAEAFDEDVETALARETDDGPGDLENLPPSDFDGFATDDVEEEL